MWFFCFSDARCCDRPRPPRCCVQLLAAFVSLWTCWLFIFVVSCESNCCHSCHCWCGGGGCGGGGGGCCCRCAATIFHPCWSSQLAAHSVALCQQIGPRWMPTGLLLESKEREYPTNASPPFYHFLFLSSFNVSLCPFSLSAAVICGSRRR